ncbi:YceI family protein [Rhodoferax lacus]|uniref:YceI family protein n=1 Tax=Rhodoferax lacus TaxID=2184758 RepID=UPI0018F56AAE|nr:YceI family protein [Rhodoferax lacus]
MHTQTLLLALAAASVGAIAEPVSYTMDPAHTYPSFEADHMGMSYWRGKMNQSSGQVVLDRQTGTGTLEVAIDLASIDFGLPAMNAWAIGNNFFNVEKSPQAIYKGTLEKFVDGSPTLVSGALTLNGRTQPVNLSINRFKCMPHPVLKREFCGADASGSFQRDAFGLDAGKAYGFNMEVALRIQVEAVANK